MLRLVLSDLDGTLLRSDKAISAYTQDILRQCRSRGILVGFCTSRGRTSIIPWQEQVRPDVVICNGGASVFHRGELIHSVSFSLAETRALIARAYEVCGPDCEITVDTMDRIYWNRGADKSQGYADDAVTDDLRDFREAALKICVQTDDPDAARRIAGAVEGCDFLPFSDIPWHKFSGGRATKEEAIRVLSERTGIGTADIIAFGDDHNDIGMLRLCGTGVAMGNAIPQAKEAADDITGTNDEDGVARYLERILRGGTASQNRV